MVLAVGNHDLGVDPFADPSWLDHDSNNHFLFYPQSGISLSKTGQDEATVSITYEERFRTYHYKLIGKDTIIFALNAGYYTRDER